jgi:hypothetical protein
MAEKLDPRQVGTWEVLNERIAAGVKRQPMTIDELQGLLRAEENIKENVWAIEPESVPDGVLGLKRIEDGRWHVILNERGLRLINRTFRNESDACRFFLKSVLDDPTFWTAVPIVGADYHVYAHHIELLARYGFLRGEGDTKYWYLLIFVILFLGISTAPLVVWEYGSVLSGVMAKLADILGWVLTLAYILGWVFCGFSKALSRYHRFIRYRFGWGTEALATIVYYVCGGIVWLFYVWLVAISLHHGMIRG